MAINAPQIAYRSEIVNGFDKTVSVLRDTVTTEFMERGGSAVFLVNDTINQVAHSRGLNGDIPADPLALTQTTATLVPWHKLVRVNDFNMFSAQSNLIDPMKKSVMAAINRKIDDDIITTLNTGTVTDTTGGTMTVAKAMKARGILGANKVADDGNLTFLISPAALTYLMQASEFANSQYVEARPYVTGKPNYGDMRMVYKWAGMTVIVDPTLPGAGTSSEKCFLFHKNALGHAINKNALEFDMDYDREQKYSWANCSAFFGTALLQNTGVVVITHDGSAVVSG
jgi:hypothetical protein